MFRNSGSFDVVPAENASPKIRRRHRKKLVYWLASTHIIPLKQNARTSPYRHEYTRSRVLSM